MQGEYNPLKRETKTRPKKNKKRDMACNYGVHKILLLSSVSLAFFLVSPLSELKPRWVNKTLQLADRASSCLLLWILHCLIPST